MIGDPPYRITADMSYDMAEGTLNIWDGLVREAIEVRKNLLDKVLRQAVIIELEKLGYTVLSPTTKD